MTISNGTVSSNALELCCDDITEQIQSIAAQSQYGPSAENIARSVLEAYSPSPQNTLKNVLFLALHNNLVLGFLEMRITYDDAEIDFVAADSAFRRLGIGKWLVSNALQYANKQKAKRIILEVGETNEAAIDLYKNVGFRQIATRSKYYKNGENAFILEKRTENTTE